MRNKFDKELDLLNNELIEMGNLIESSIKAAITALDEQNIELAKRVIENDKEIDDMERAIEQRCLKLLIRHQPVAKDLRFISAALKMITDMERIGDQAADISEISIRLAEETYLKELIHIPQMAEATIKMVKSSIDSFVNRDITLVKKVIAYDDTVDELFDIIKNELVELIIQDINYKEQSIDFLMIAKYLERIGDHAQNIAEWVYFAITGEHYTW
ncbi:phosphate transport system protein [Keratinibaculum paraultunense]|uniref:Phosphate-specific transport system accessory protein PhoU n=1 Tax=Keratinibaculum paraultunense TaxID=1278232 RepID=A0A4R3KTW0_9FIRM|nr:phosphate signaling complex protein PhoU [Keratinibaculum paraultunense]QQY79795.1 phosphate signaling complex protein PhoU [Keratinibaculum paraultunense]TCS88675.1 phosphate transport system protein [Keratinibaculum paraultunense]